MWHGWKKEKDKKTVVFITDCSDVAYNELRAVIISHLRKLDNNVEVEIEPVASVAPFSIINGNFVLRLLADVYPEDTIFSVILNPLKERPARLLGRTKKRNFYFMGANTGVFEWFFRDFGIKEIYELHDPGFLPFGGKYVHAPIIAKIASGQQLDSLGEKFNINNLKRLNIVDGTIVHIDNFGLMKFTGKMPEIKEGDKLIISIGEKSFSAVYLKRMMGGETGEWVIYPGSSFGLLEVGKVRQNGAKEIEVKIGDIVRLTARNKNPYTVRI